ncbi:MAG: hypothetical protein K1X44_03940 [Alphaproteobacteria bacterium]|nr:hypothetical protein [Alphaproteobacteria bacterium]
MKNYRIFLCFLVIYFFNNIPLYAVDKNSTTIKSELFDISKFVPTILPESYTPKSCRLTPLSEYEEKAQLTFLYNCVYSSEETNDNILVIIGFNPQLQPITQTVLKIKEGEFYNLLAAKSDQFLLEERLPFDVNSNNGQFLYKIVAYDYKNNSLWSFDDTKLTSLKLKNYHIVSINHAVPIKNGHYIVSVDVQNINQATSYKNLILDITANGKISWAYMDEYAEVFFQEADLFYNQSNNQIVILKNLYEGDGQGQKNNLLKLNNQDSFLISLDSNGREANRKNIGQLKLNNLASGLYRDGSLILVGMNADNKLEFLWFDSTLNSKQHNTLSPIIENKTTKSENEDFILKNLMFLSDKNFIILGNQYSDKDQENINISDSIDEGMAHMLSGQLTLLHVNPQGQIIDNNMLMDLSLIKEISLNSLITEMIRLNDQSILANIMLGDTNRFYKITIP